MAVVNNRAVVGTTEMYGVTAIRLSSTLGTNLDQTIKALFSNNEQGFVYDPNDMSTMFQDAGGVTPVTAAGQPVGLIRDKSGRGNHAYQTTGASRPVLRRNVTTGTYYLEFDGIDDFLQVDSIDFTATDKVSLFTGLRKLRTTIAESILELGVLPYDGVGTFWLTTNALAPSDVWMAIAQAWNARTGFSKIAPDANNFIFSAKLDFAGGVAKDEVKPRLNGNTEGFTRGLLEHAGTGNFGNHPMYIGSRTGTSLHFNGHLYSLIGVGRLTTDNETITLEKRIAKYTGVVLSV